MLRRLLDHLKFLEQKIAEVEQQTEKCTGSFEKIVTLWTTIPRVEVVTAWAASHTKATYVAARARSEAQGRKP